ncbi:alkaline phosphatase D family protein [Microtetraspora niveoalba]|uniref:alkaline phosphatase D family protein n=1 Tax=Microtetraspora niveoalba TaxID=46175 RepID=UPI000832C274|nr:alkaline phosphatase D family protein [Microtetraspora niveoalba]
MASGEPLPDGVILWTRLAPEPLDPVRPGGMPDRTVTVRWELAEDEKFARVVRSGAAPARPDWAHSVHVKVSDLRPGTEYFYRFSVDGHESPAGRTRTAPDPGSTAPVRFAFASCQRYEHGRFTALRHLAAERPDVILHLGGYMYAHEAEGPAPGEPPVRPLESDAECATLAAYRNRYATYRTDPDLRAAHAAAPWLPVPDDHEVRAGYAGALSGDGSSPAAFLKRRTAAFKAYYEHMPLRARPAAASLRVHRWRPYGRVADLMLLDTRQHRDGGDMLGPEQEEWLLGRLKSGTARWRVLAQPAFFGPRGLADASAAGWDAFPESRARVLAAAPAGLVVLSGDAGDGWAGDLRADRADPESRALGVEFAAPSVSARPSGVVPAGDPYRPIAAGRRGYVMCTADMDGFRAEFRVVGTVEHADRPDAPVSTVARFEVVDDRLRRTEDGAASSE